MASWNEYAASFFTILGGRKMVLGLVLIGTGVMSEMIMKDHGGISSNLLALFLGIYGSFAVGNVTSKLAFNKRPHTLVPPTDQPAPLSVETQEETGGQPTPSGSDLDSMQAKLDAILAASNTNGQALSYLVNYINGNNAA